MDYVAVGIFGVLGSIARYELGAVTADWLAIGSFPLGTLLCNLLGCFLLSAFLAWTKGGALPAYLRTGVGTGFVGSFTTFSAFSVESVLLMHHHEWAIFLTYIGLSVAGGLFMSWFGGKVATAAAA